MANLIEEFEGLVDQWISPELKAMDRKMVFAKHPDGEYVLEDVRSAFAGYCACHQNPIVIQRILNDPGYDYSKEAPSLCSELTDEVHAFVQRTRMFQATGLTPDLIQHIQWLHYCLRDTGYCIDGGKCHHHCGENACSRQETCAPLSGSRMGADWSIPGTRELLGNRVRAYGVFRQRVDENEGREFFYHALWHRDYSPGEGERLVPGFFVPDPCCDEHAKTPDYAKLLKFYDVDSLEDLVRAQSKHVEKLQEKLQGYERPQPVLFNPRKG